MSDSDTSGSESPDSDENVDNPLVRAWDRLKSDIDTQQIREVVNVENGRPKIDPKKAKELAQSNNKWAVKGATGGAIVGAIISISGVLVIPAAAAGAALGYAIDRNAVDRVEELEEDFQTILEAIEDEEEVDLSRLAMITHIKKKHSRTSISPISKIKVLLNLMKKTISSYSESLLFTKRCPICVVRLTSFSPSFYR